MPQGKFFEFVAVATDYDRYLLWMSYFNVNFMEPTQPMIKYVLLKKKLFKCKIS